MTDATADWRALLAIMADAFAAGDNQRGEGLLTEALDAGAPWDVATATVAQALSRHTLGSARQPAPYAAPA